MPGMLRTWLLTLLLPLSILVGCRNSQGVTSSTETPLLRVGYRPAALADVTPVIIKEAGIKSSAFALGTTPLSSPGDAFSKFMVGEVDVIAGIPLETILKQLQDGPPKRAFHAYYLQVDVNGEGWVSLLCSKTSGVRTISDLAGREVGSLPTDQARYLLRRILLAGGVPAASIRITSYNPAAPLLGIRSGEQAAIFGLEPALSRASIEGHYILAKGPVSHYLFDDQPVPVSASLIADDLTAKNPKIESALLDVVDRALRFAKENPIRARGFFTLPANGGLDPAAARNLFFPVMQKPNLALKTTTKRLVADLVKDHLIKPTVTIGRLFPGV